MWRCRREGSAGVEEPGRFDPTVLPVPRLVVHRSERADALVDALGDVVSTGLADPLQTEVISVPTRGVERWLTQRLSGRLGTSPGRADGVCANVDFPFPGRLIGGAVAGASGVDRDEDPWLPERAVWPLLDLIDAGMEEPWLATVAGHLAGSTRSRRFGTARHLTDLYDRYAVHRPEMLRAWATGADVDDAGTALPADSRWQAELWRRLRARVGAPSPAERLERACDRLVADPSLADLPERVSLFGLTRLPASYLQVLRALAASRDVHLFLLHPSPALWDLVAGAGPSPRRRADDHTADLARHPLLASWGRDAREMQLVLGPVHEQHEPVDAGPPDTLLRRVQHAVRQDTPPPGEPLPGQPDARPTLDVSDRSVQVHACHGRARQVEVLRDAVLHLLLDDPTLEPRDVIVMCPDIEAFAPLIHATFGAGADPDDGDDAPIDLRVRLADRSLRQTNPVLGAVWNLLTLADSRVTAPEVVDFAGRDPVRRRFRIDDDDLARISEWVAATGIRWGLDAAHRAPFHLDGLAQNTWSAGLDRVLLGVSMADEDQRLVGGVVPLDDVDSGSIDLAGRFAELVERLRAALDSLAGPQSAARWVHAVAGAAGALTATTSDDGWQHAQLQRILDDVLAEAAGSPARLELAEFRSLLSDRLRGQPTRANFRTGHLTVCTLVPMRSVPHRVVCLLGLDDGAFPRKTERDGDDLVLTDPHVGDRDGRNEDVQLLLDAVLAATERLVVTYAGRDDRTNAERPPAVPVGELLDVIDRTVRLDGGAPARTRVVVHHPLQPFDGRNFTPGRLVPDRPWSFDPVTLEGARALAGERREPAPFLAGVLPPKRAEVVALDDLVRFVEHPVRAFLRQRLGISLGDWSVDLADALPVDLDGLESWQVGDRILQARLAGAGMDACVAAELARGHLPPGALSETALGRMRSTIDRLLAATPAGDPDSVEVNVRLDDGRLLVGTVPGLVGDVARTVTYSKLKPKHRLAAWARYLALEARYSIVTVGRRRAGGEPYRDITVACLAAGALDGATARRLLHDLVGLFDRGLCEPLALYCATSAAYATAPANRAATAGRKTWESAKFPGEGAEPEHQLVLGRIPPFDEVLADPRFEEDARRLWAGVLATETVEDR
jgi:exodeoxyribonuclease V gamma subunit